MKIVEKLRGPGPHFSFEYFPPRDEAGLAALFETIHRLKRYAPAYVSMTYGAGGSTRQLTMDLVSRIKAETGIEAMAHLTCVGSTRDELASILDQYRAAGIENLMALRGDPPRGQTGFVRTEGGFGYASELVAFIRSRYDFCLASACYPEKHPEAPDAETDLAHLRHKVDAGADFLVTQLFFDNQDYLGFVRRARAAGIRVPIIPGIMPITSLSQIKRFTATCGAHIPDDLLERLEAASDDTAVV
jgi:methylenetetrahydrofolate reductase (NADPH)